MVECNLSDHKEYISNLWNSIPENGGQTVVLRSYRQDNVVFNREAIEKLLPEKSNYIWAPDISKVPAPLFIPQFLEHLISIADPREVQKLIKDSFDLPVHQKIVLSYLENGLAERKNELMHKEYYFERELLKRGITKLIKKIVKNRPIILLIENWEKLTPSFISIIENINRELFKIPMLISISYFSEKSTVSLPFIFFNEDLSINTIDLPHECNLYIKESSTQKILTHKEAFEASLNGYLFFAIEESYNYMHSLLPQVRQGETNLKYKERVLFLKLGGLLSSFMNKSQESFSIFNGLLTMGQINEDKATEIMAFRIIGSIYSRRGHFNSAMKFYNKAKNLAKKVEHIDEELRLGLAILENGYLEYGEKKESDEFTRLIDIAKDDELLSRMLIRAPEFKIENKQKIEYLKKGIDIAISTRNLSLAGDGYYNIATVEQVAGNIDEVEKYLLLCKRIRDDLGSPLDRAIFYNGFGYFQQIRGRYSEAMRHYNSALELLSIEMDIKEVALVYYNIASAFLLSIRNEQASRYYEMCVTLMQQQKMERLKNHSIESIEALIGLSSLNANQLPRAERIRKNIKFYIESSEKLDFEEDVIFNLFEASYLAREQMWIEADNLMEKSLLSTIEHHFWILPKIYLDWGKSYINRNNFEKAHQVWQDGKDKMSFYENQTYINIFNNLFNGSMELPQLDIGESFPSSKEKVELSIRKSFQEERIVTASNEITLLNSLQIIFSGENQREELIQQTMKRLLSSFLLNTLYFYEKLEDHFILSYYASILDNKPEDYSTILNDIEKWEDNKPYYIIKKGDSPLVLFPLNSENTNRGYILCIMETLIHIFSENDLNSLSILTQEFSEALIQIERHSDIRSHNAELKRRNETLSKSALSDSLTGVGNRNNMISALLKELSVHKRENSVLSLMFIDLDGFKEYNDRFGHAIGDFILKKSAQLIASTCRGIDNLFRYGGDEFIILLPESNCKKAKIIAARIIKAFTKQAGFFKEIEDNFSIIVDKSINCLNCSIGISDTELSGLDSERIVGDADSALYIAKLEGKGKAVIYTPNRETVQQ